MLLEKFTNLHRTACIESDFWTVSDGLNGESHILRMRLKPQHAAELEIDPLLTFRYDSEKLELLGALADGTPLDYSSDIEPPFGEPGMSGYELCKLEPLVTAGNQLAHAIYCAKYKADAAAGRLRSIVIVGADGEYWPDDGECHSQVSVRTAINVIEGVFYEANWKRRYPTPIIRMAGSDEEADFLAYNAPSGDYRDFNQEAVVAAGGMLIARLKIEWPDEPSND